MINKMSAENVKHLGDMIVEALLTSGNSDSSVKKKVDDLKSIMRWFAKRHMISIGDFISEIKFGSVKIDVEVLTMDETRYVLNEESNIRKKCSPVQSIVLDYWIAALHLGARFGDMVSWTKDNLISDNGEMWLSYNQEKTGQEITVPVPARVEEIFSDNLRNYGRPLRHISYNPTNVLKQIAKKMPIFRKEFTRVRKYAGKPVRITGQRWEFLSIHKMRGTAITNMLDANVPEHIVKSFSGHVGDSRSFARYVKPHADEKRKAIINYSSSLNEKKL
jgi:integrase